MTKFALSFAAGLAVSVTAMAQSFTPGNLVVSIVEMPGTSSNTGRPVSVQQFDLAGLSGSFNASRVLALPASPNQTTTVANSFVLSGSATSEGNLTLSPDRTTLGLAGYNTWVLRGGNTSFTTGSVASTLNFAGNTGTTFAANVPRIVASIPANYSTTSYTLMGNTYSGSNFRTAVVDGSGFLLGGTSLTNNTGNRATGGARSFSGGPNSVALTGAQSPDVLVPSLVNTRQVARDLSGNVIIATQQATAGITPGLYQVISGNAVLLPGFAAPAFGAWGPNDFEFITSTTLYIADDGSAGNAPAQWGGLQRWDFNGTTWALSYVINQVVANAQNVFAGLRSITVTTDGQQNTIYGIDTGGRLVAVVDAGASSVFTTLATPAAGQFFRGVEVTPGTAIPTPAGAALLSLGGLVAMRRRRR